MFSNSQCDDIAWEPGQSRSAASAVAIVRACQCFHCDNAQQAASESGTEDMHVKSYWLPALASHPAPIVRRPRIPMAAPGGKAVTIR